jgi:hypothetical protein
VVLVSVATDVIDCVSVTVESEIYVIVPAAMVEVVVLSITLVCVLVVVVTGVSGAKRAYEVK